MPRILLLNPPHPKVVIRDYFCSKISQADYLPHPIDFVCLSGRLSGVGDVSLIDAVAAKLSPFECRALVNATSPAVIVGLTGYASRRSDMEFYSGIAENRSLYLIGDFLREAPEKFLDQYSFVAGVLTDFISDGLARRIERAPGPYAGLVLRGDAPVDGRISGAFELPVPRHDLFAGFDYRYPFVMGRRFASVMTEYGCPHDCGFCVMGTLGHAVRPAENVAPELEAIARLGVRDIFFVDQSFGSTPSHTRDMLALLESMKPKFRWLCFSRPDSVDEESLRRYRAAGCHTVIFGIETARPELLGRYRKRYTREQAGAAFRAASKAGLRTVGTLILGLPGDTEEGFRESVSFVKSLPCDYLSLNVAVPRAGTQMREECVREGWARDAEGEMDQSGTSFAVDSPGLPIAAQERLKRWALREFYLNTEYILRRFLGIRSAAQFAVEARQGISLLKNILGKS